MPGQTERQNTVRVNGNFAPSFIFCKQFTIFYRPSNQGTVRWSIYFEKLHHSITREILNYKKHNSLQ